MLYRSLLLLITALFITMWTLLIRSEVQPGGNSLRALRVEDVLREVFQAEKRSNLIIHNGSQRVGTLQLAGQGEAEEGTRSLQFLGNALIEFPGMDPQRSAWKGEFVVTPDWKLKTVTLSVSSRGTARDAGAATQFDLVVSPLEETASYTLKAGRSLIDEQTFTTDEAGVAALLDHLEVDPMLIKHFHPGAGMKPAISAHEATLAFNNAKLETSLLTVTVGGQTLLEAHISKLGEVLQVTRTLVGWTLDVL